jgi:probable HAF family extracellular repeat protein
VALLIIPIAVVGQWSLKSRSRGAVHLATVLSAVLTATVSFVTSIVVFTPCVAGAAGYSVIDLGTLPEGTSAVVRTLSDAEEIVGSGQFGRGPRAFILTRTGLQELDGGDPTDYSVASGINARGDVVGSRNSSTALRAFRWTRGQGFVDLLPLSGDSGSAALAVNDRGQAAGYSSGLGETRAVVWAADGLPQPLPGAPPSRALSINGAGDVVGVSASRAVLWSGGSVQDLGTLPGHSTSEALNINVRGEVVGSSGDLSQRRAVLWTPGAVPLDLGALNGGTSSRALWINQLSQVVGTSESLLGSRAFIWTRTGGMQDLNGLVGGTASFVLTHAVTVNNLGMILAIGHDDLHEPGAHLPGTHDLHELPVRVFLLLPVP